MKKSVIIVLGLSLMLFGCDGDNGGTGGGGSGGSGGSAGTGGGGTGGGGLDPIAAPEFLAMDCELVGNSAALPLDAKVTPFDTAVAGQPVDVVIEDVLGIPAPLVCGFIGAGFTSVEVDNSFVTNAISNADITSAVLDSFIDDDTPGDALVSPHNLVFLDFGVACGDNCVDSLCNDGVTACTASNFTDVCPDVGTGPGIAVSTFRRDGDTGTIPPGPTPFPITPSAAGTVDFVIEYAGTALHLQNLGIFPMLCLGGGCGAGNDFCAAIDRGGIASPRIMYDAICNKAQAEAGDCEPFEGFAGEADVCKGSGISTDDFASGNIPACCDNSTDLFCTDAANIASCCTAISEDYPTATAAQQPQLPVN